MRRVAARRKDNSSGTVWFVHSFFRAGTRWIRQPRHSSAAGRRPPMSEVSTSTSHRPVAAAAAARWPAACSAPP